MAGSHRLQEQELSDSTQFSSVRQSPGRLSAVVVAQMVLINLLWGASSVAVKAALTDVGPFTLAVLRFIPAGLVLWAVSARYAATRILGSDRPALVYLSVAGITVAYGIYFHGVKTATATDSSLLFACEPLMIALFAWLFLREKLTRLQWLGLILGIAGIRLIAGGRFGSLLIILALAFESSTCVAAKRLTSRYDGLAIAGRQMVIGAVCLLPFAAWELARSPFHISIAGAGGILYLSLICSLFCYGVWYHNLRANSISAMAAFILLQPLTGPLFGWALRHETLSAASAAGGALVISGIACATLSRAKRNAPEEPVTPATLPEACNG